VNTAWNKKSPEGLRFERNNPSSTLSPEQENSADRKDLDPTMSQDWSP